MSIADKIESMDLDKTKVPTTLGIVIELIEKIKLINSKIEEVLSDLVDIDIRVTNLEKI